MKIVLLSGGSGQRLWPLSNDNCSKQYIKFIEHDKEVSEENLLSRRNEKCSMLQRVYEQLCEVGFSEDVIVAASESQREIVAGQLGDKVLFSSEPMRRDTFPAVLLASSFVKTKCKASEDEVVAFVPVDPYVNIDYFKKISELGELVKTRKGVIGLMGAKPTYPSEKYGYILMNDAEGTEVKGFAEKPDLTKAEELLADGALWNCGVFCFKLSTAAKWAAKYNLPFDYDVLYKEESYETLPKISFDYEVLEHTDNIIAVSYGGMWKDIGTWNTLTEEMSENILGKAVMDDTSAGSDVINTLEVPVILMGGKDLVVVASRDGILVADKERSSHLKQYLDKVDTTPRYEERKWGTIKTLERSVEDGVGVVTNKVKVEPGQFTTYHRHLLHDEIITVISGTGTLLLNGTKILLAPGTTFTVSRGMLHQILANSKLKYIEVLMGQVDKDDIERVLL